MTKHFIFYVFIGKQSKDNLETLLVTPKSCDCQAPLITHESDGPITSR